VDLIAACLSCALVLRGGHASPTRRSSDLRIEEVGPFRGERAERPGELGLGKQLAERRRAAVPCEDPLPLGIRRHGRVLADRLTQDRKSTRLNSSHQIISYAVFCLNKKNTI